jgi:hypothetical protein
VQEGKFKTDLQKMYKFLDLNRGQDKFRGEVLGPLAMDLEFPDNTEAKVVQACIGYKQRFVFLFSDREDFQLANDYLIKERLSVTIFDTSSLSRTKRASSLNQQQLKQLGLTGFVMDLVRDAPETIQIFLNQRVGLSNICYGPDSAVGSQIREARSMSRDTITQGIGIKPLGRDDVICISHRVVVRGSNVGFEQSGQSETLTFSVGRQPETDTSALQARIESVTGQLETARNQEEAAQTKMRNIRSRLKEIDIKLKEPADLEAQIRALQRRHNEKLDDLNNLPSVEELEQKVSKKAEALRKNIDAFARSYSGSVALQPQVWVHCFWLLQN